MERLAQLIGKLNEQFAQNADPFQLLVTTQLIETELVQMSTSTHRTVNSSKVAVVMPAANGHGYQNRRTADEIKPQPVVNTPAGVETTPVVHTAAAVETQPVVNIPVVVEAKTVLNTPAEVEAEPVVNGKVNGTNGTVDKNNNGHHHQAEQAANGWKFDPLREIPTLAHQ